MSESQVHAKARTGLWPGFVWAVPLAALLIVAYLGLRALADRGVDVVVTFAAAGGARPGDTQVIYKGVEVGHVTKVTLNRDAHHVDMTLRLDGKLRPVITTGTKFWLVGANPSLTDLNSLKAAVSGVSIGMAPGRGQPTRRLVGLDEEPVVAPNTPGRAFVLQVDSLGALRRGSTVIYHGYDAGKVTEVAPVGPGGFRATLFILSPFDQYVRPDSLFWNASSVQISLTGQGITGQIASPNTALSGGVAFDTPSSALAEPPSPSDAIFPLYTDRGRAQQGPDGPAVLYQAVFPGTAGELGVGSLVTLKGARIGEVESVGLAFDASTGAITNPVTFAIFPQRLHIAGLDATALEDWQALSDKALQRLLQLGYRARIDQSPPLIGARSIGLDRIAAASPAALIPGGVHPGVPVASSADAASLADKADALLTKANAIPIEAIGRDVRQITDRLKTLASSPKLQDSLDHLDSTLNSVDQMVKAVKPQVGPLIAKLNQAADQLQQTAASANGVLSGHGAGQDQSLPAAIEQLTDAARSIRSLADYLGRHPEAVIQGRVKDAR